MGLKETKQFFIPAWPNSKDTDVVDSIFISHSFCGIFLPNNFYFISILLELFGQYSGTVSEYFQSQAGFNLDSW